MLEIEQIQQIQQMMIVGSWERQERKAESSLVYVSIRALGGRRREDREEKKGKN